ncbi:hypothetical protein TNCV_2063631 [Trichonephila clavipes]|nr:hypothetical protein TNCV_2063631 [Trichonephila clavipes]
MIAKVLAYGTEDAQIESSFIGEPWQCKRTAPFACSCHGAINTPQKQPSRQIYDAIKPSDTNDSTHTSRHHE